MAVNILLLVVSHLVVPIWLIVSLWRAHFTSRIAWLVSVLAYGAFILYILLAGAGWDWVRYYFRVAVPLAFLVAIYVSSRRIARAKLPWWRRPESLRVGADLAANGVLFAIFTLLIAIAIQGLSYGTIRAAELSFPLRNGIYYVAHGGANPLLNYHNVDRAQRFALDIVKLNVAGTRASGVYPSDPAHYAVFGEEIRSPCAGEVLAAKDELPDLRPPQTDRQNLAGNHVVVRCLDEQVDVMLAHMMAGSVAVEPGQRIVAGQLLGAVGNSGNTSEPHLHIHAIKSDSGSILDGEGVPILFDGRFLVRNSLVVK